MKQISFADAEYAGKRKQTRRERFLIEMDQVVPWKGLIALIEPHYPKGNGGRPAYPLMAMLRVHLMQNWFGYSDPVMEESLYETKIFRLFAGLNLNRIPDETTILNSFTLLDPLVEGGVPIPLCLFKIPAGFPSPAADHIEQAIFWMKCSMRARRMFGKRLTELAPIKEAVATYMMRASEKLRAQKSYCKKVRVSIRTGMFNPDEASLRSISPQRRPG